MFTGIVEELGTIKSIVHGARSVKISVNAAKVLGDVQLGDSIAVNGVCLTVTNFAKDSFTADVMPETVRRTGLSFLKNGDSVNLERALCLNSRLGGHIVSGHVDGLGEIISLTKDDNAVIVKIKTEENIARYIVEKGSVTLDGISLTVVESGRSSFSVSLIPHTAEVTTFGKKQAGDFVNIENDIIGKYVERLLNFSEVKNVPASNITMDFLAKHGF